KIVGKYYLVDAEYGIRNGYITLYRGVRYHLKELSAQEPKNAKELFNLCRSSLRITIERKELESNLIIPTLTEREEREEAREWSTKREEIRQTMWTDYMARNIRWTKPMEHLFLEILAEEAQKGNKPSNTFKAVSINRVAVAISKRFQVQCDAKHVENHLRTDDNMKMITCDRATYDVAVMAHKKYEPFLNKSIDHYDEMALVVGKDMATGSFAKTFADIDLDDGNQDLVPIDYDNEEIEEVRTKVSSSGTSKRKRKNAQESVVDEQIKFVGEQLGKIANALEQFTANKTPHLYKEVMSMEVEGFEDDFLCSVFDYLVGHESKAKAFLVKSKKHRKIWLQKFSQG
ncbi:hypothetical protein Gotur_029289, partial [Gossypium turneri]